MQTLLKPLISAIMASAILIAFQQLAFAENAVKQENTSHPRRATITWYDTKHYCMRRVLLR